MTTQDRYSTGAIWFHWTIAVLVIVNILIGLFHENLLAGVSAMPLHKSIGITVLVLSAGRLAWRLTHRPPALPAAMAGWEKLGAKAVHWTLYAMMFVLPLTGWAMSSNPEHPRPLTWFGLFPVPLLPVAPQAAGAAHQAHVLLGWAMGALVLLHVLAALRHHLLLRDRVLVAMAPGLARRG